MRKFLCFLGFHAWSYDHHAKRHCIHCQRREEITGDELNEFDPLWTKVD